MFHKIGIAFEVNYEMRFCLLFSFVWVCLFICRVFCACALKYVENQLRIIYAHNSLVNKRNGNFQAEFYGYGHGTNGFQSKPKAKWKSTLLFFIIWYAVMGVFECVSSWGEPQEQFNGGDEFLMLNATSHHQIWNSMLLHGKTWYVGSLVTFGQDQVNSPKR